MSYRFFAVSLWALLFAVLGPVAAPSFFASQAEAQTISRIVVEGNQRIEPDTVMSYMQIGAGDPYDPMLIDESVKALFQTGLFCRRKDLHARIFSSWWLWKKTR